MKQREIKFRLRRDNTIVGYEKWDGSFDDWSYSVDGECCWTRRPIGHNEKDQCTRLKDKKGKEIYEGDIVINSDFDYGKKKDRFKDNIIKDLRYDIEWLKGVEDYKVIGNIYENKELLQT